MGDRYVLAIDCGTQSVRGLLFDDRGHLVAKHKVEFEPYSSPVPAETQPLRLNGIDPSADIHSPLNLRAI